MLASVGLIFAVKNILDPATIFFVMAPVALASIGCVLCLILLMRMLKILSRLDEVSPI